MTNVRIAILIIIIVFTLAIKMMGAIMFTTLSSKVAPGDFHFLLEEEKFKTHCKIEFTYASHCDSKNLTPRNMLKKFFDS